MSQGRIDGGTAEGRILLFLYESTSAISSSSINVESDSYSSHLSPPLLLSLNSVSGIVNIETTANFDSCRIQPDLQQCIISALPSLFFLFDDRLRNLTFRNAVWIRAGPTPAPLALDHGYHGKLEEVLDPTSE